MLVILFIICFMTSLFSADNLFITTSFYDGLGEKFRVETVSHFQNCQGRKMAQKIFLHKKNELREVAYWDHQGKIHEAGKTNHPEIHQIVNGLFGKAVKINQSNPCEMDDLSFKN